MDTCPYRTQLPRRNLLSRTAEPSRVSMVAPISLKEVNDD